MLKKIKNFFRSKATLAAENDDLRLQAANMREALEFYNLWAEMLNAQMGRDVSPSLWGRCKTALRQSAGKEYRAEMENLRREKMSMEFDIKQLTERCKKLEGRLESISPSVIEEGVRFTRMDDRELELLMPLEEFIDGCKTLCFMDDDGMGFYATSEFVTNLAVDPGRLVDEAPPPGFTHVVWYNK